MTKKLSQAEVLRYSRHLMLPDVGLEGQQRLKDASVLVVGTGGLGSPAALYLAAAGIGHIGLVDYDVVDESNLQRQVIHSTTQVGTPKVESARLRMLELNPYIQVDTYNLALDSSNAIEIAAEYQILVDGTDNFPTRYLLNDLAVITGKPYVYGSIFRFEGQVSVFDARRGPCYRCLFPEPPPPDIVPTCTEGGVFGVLPGTIGTLQATEVLKLILGVGEPMIGRLLMYDALDSSFQTITLRKNPACKVCGEKAAIRHLIDYEQFCGGTVQRQAAKLDPSWLIEPAELARRLKEGEPIQLLDVRDPVEGQISGLPGAEFVSIQMLDDWIGRHGQDETVVVICRTGSRSGRAVKLLQKAGFVNALNLSGGLNAWARDVDQNMLQY